MDGDEESSTKYNFDSHAKQDVASRQFFNFNYIVLLFPPFWKKKKKNGEVHLHILTLGRVSRKVIRVRSTSMAALGWDDLSLSLI